MASSTFADRPIKKLCLFDVDGTLTPARQVRTPSRCDASPPQEMISRAEILDNLHP